VELSYKCEAFSQENEDQRATIEELRTRSLANENNELRATIEQ